MNFGNQLKNLNSFVQPHGLLTVHNLKTILFCYPFFNFFSIEKITRKNLRKFNSHCIKSSLYYSIIDSAYNYKRINQAGTITLNQIQTTSITSSVRFDWLSISKRLFDRSHLYAKVVLCINELPTFFEVGSYLKSGLSLSKHSALGVIICLISVCD
jgi:hypothetical protein